MTTFSVQQQSFIKMGEVLNQRMVSLVEEALGVKAKQVKDKRHVYIFSPPGAGKTFTTQEVAKKHKVELVKIQGVATMSAVVAKLAYAAYVSQGRPIHVWVDDCDSLFMDANNLNIMKGVLDTERNTLAYNKNLSVQIGMLLQSDNPNEQLIGEALRHYQVPGSVGVEVPTHNMTFLITSNKDLTPPSANLNTAKKMHEAAIRDRVGYQAFNLDMQKQWGWVAYIALKAKVHGITKAQKEELLTWMWDNWTHLPATSMRTVTELAAMMVNNPKGYHTDWALYLI